MVSLFGWWTNDDIGGSQQVVLTQGNIRGCLSTSPLPVSIIYSSNNIVCRTNNWEGVFLEGYFCLVLLKIWMMMLADIK